MADTNPPTEIPERDFRRSPAYRELQQTRAAVAERRRAARAERMRRWRQDGARWAVLHVGTWLVPMLAFAVLVIWWLS